MDIQEQDHLKTCIALTLYSFIAFQQTCEEKRSTLTTSLKCVVLCCQVCSFFCTVARFFQENASKLSKPSSEGHSSDASHKAETGSPENSSSLTSVAPEFPQNLFAEWNEFFSSTLFTTVLQLFLCHSGKRRTQTPRSSRLVLKSEKVTP